MLTETTHVSLLEDLRRGRSSAWSEFQDRYGELIRSVARRAGLQTSDCDDLLQDVLLALTKSMPGFEYDPAKGKFRSYLKTVALHAIFRLSGQDLGWTALGPAEVLSADNPIEQAWEDEWRQYHVRRAMAAIESEFNQSHCKAFQLCEIDGKDAKAVAIALDTTPNAVHQACSRIRRRLRELLGRQVAEEG